MCLYCHVVVPNRACTICTCTTHSCASSLAYISIALRTFSAIYRYVYAAFTTIQNAITFPLCSSWVHDVAAAPINGWALRQPCEAPPRLDSGPQNNDMIVERAGGGRHDAQVEVHLTAVEGDLRAWAAPPRTWLPNGVWDARADRAST